MAQVRALGLFVAHCILGLVVFVGAAYAAVALGAKPTVPALAAAVAVLLLALVISWVFP